MLDPTQLSRMDALIPAPVHARPDPAADFAVTAATAVHAADAAASVGEHVAEVLRACTGHPIPVREGPAPDGAITLTLDSAVGHPEGYRLSVTNRQVTLRAAAPAGLFAGVQTLRQLLPAVAGPWTIAGGEIRDQPRFAYRGAMLDVSRHFYTVAEVKRFIDQIARYKLNVLHLHLTDDQSWRIEIRSWPRLATYGGSTQVGGGPGGHYTQEQYQDLVAYAASRHITVIPEIDVPGHTTAALASYPELNADGVAPALFTGQGNATGFSSLATDKELTYRFVDDVLREVAALTPGDYLHLGTDETHATPEEGRLAFIDRVLPMVARHGKTVIGWHELLRSPDLPVSAIPQYWGRERSDPLMAAAVAGGHRVLLSPAHRVYLDMKYDLSTPIGYKWAGCIDVADTYDWDPGTYMDGVPEPAVLGVEAPLWSETLNSYADVEYMAFPRLAALAEVAWSPWSTHDWDSFARRLATHGPRWEAQQMNFYRSPQIPWIS
ncbi:beta-N-acetylhexosaminidase [Dactylosporangium siamense]|uniref:beta-N-acetylhexosaminidase n=1 Tax=Dactylosporangium siamense TaxID=685454 RepID=A0A919UFP4_9ACTN|nr:beta-N-acetylhexosaminidase [Dactylosporangium siamense]GIG48868.1 beta-N-acetylhexosaminidase [Dactylosporangium siamense]